jgi:galactonate dehydratase
MPRENTSDRMVTAMKITDVKLYPVVPDLGQAAPAGMTGSRISWLFVQVETDEGITGTGEATNWLRRGSLIVGETLEVLKKTLVGRDPGHIEKLWNEMYRAFTYMGSRGVVTTAISGVDIALWDIKGKALGKPVYDLLGGPVRDSLLLYTHPAHPMDAKPEDLGRYGMELVKQGFTGLKIDPYRTEMVPYHTAYVGGQISLEGIRLGASKTAALRAAVGPDIEILVDLHGHYNVATAVRCIKVLEPYDVGWFEEPLPPESLDGLRQVRAQTDAPLCTGERLFSKWDFAPVLREGLVNYVMPDVVWCGGISEIRKIAIMSEGYAVPISPHQANGPIQVLAGAHAMMVSPNFFRLEIFSRQMHAFNAAISPPLDVRNGRLFLSGKPGIGAELNMDYVQRHRDPDWK